MIKYKMNVLEELKKAGYNTNKIRQEKLIPESTLTRIRKNNPDIKSVTVDTICRIVGCQPGDIFEYTPD